MEMVVRAEYPPIVRVPDMVVTRVGGPEDRLAASDVLLAVEIISSDTSMPQRSPVSSLRPCRSVCVSIFPLWSPRVPRGIGNQQWSSEWCAWFLDPGFRSWARFDYQPGSRRWPVHQFGPRRLFNEVAAAYHQWEHAGRPPVTRWRFTLTPEGQRVELTGTTQTSRGA